MLSGRGCVGNGHSTLVLRLEGGASKYSLSCDFSFFQSLIQRKTEKKKTGVVSLFLFPCWASTFCTLALVNRAMFYLKQVLGPFYSIVTRTSVPAGVSRPLRGLSYPVQYLYSFLGIWLAVQPNPRTWGMGTTSWSEGRTNGLVQGR